LDPIDEWNQNGFFCIPRFLDEATGERLRQACDAVLDRVRAEQDGYGYGHDGANIAYLTEPECFHDARPLLLRLLEFIANPEVLAYIRRLGPGEPLFHNTQYFHEQVTRDWDGAWHRDTQFETPDPEQERMRMQRDVGLHFRVAFEFDDRLQYVPGSHKRWDTAQEFAIRKGSNPTEPDMPNRTRIVLNPGDACVFHAWGIHRGTYRRHLRRTLDIIYGFGPAESAPAPTCFQTADILTELSDPARAFFTRFIETYVGRWSTASQAFKRGPA
jgi:hypothetical protein